MLLIYICKSTGSTYTSSRSTHSHLTDLADREEKEEITEVRERESKLDPDPNSMYLDPQHWSVVTHPSANCGPKLLNFIVLNDKLTIFNDNYVLAFQHVLKYVQLFTVFTICLWKCYTNGGGGGHHCSKYTVDCRTQKWFPWVCSLTERLIVS